MKHLITLTIICFSISLSDAIPFKAPRIEECSQISRTYCLNEKQYVLCNATETGETPAILTCPIEGEYCSTEVPSSCSSDPAKKTKNSHCDLCAFGDVGHACLSLTTFKNCSSNEEFNCTVGLYCDTYHPNANMPCRRYTGKEMLCWKPYEAPPPKSDAEICEAGGKEGSFEYEHDVDCTQFRVCSKDEVTGEWSGNIVTCPNGTFFDPTLGTCVPSFVFRCRKAPPVPPEHNEE
uniref:CSON011229 protein n=1 Tax=Culicoides sonorensis TaxID=179676 RepID=A0A336KIQ5_CULSO